MDVIVTPSQAYARKHPRQGRRSSTRKRRSYTVPKRIRKGILFSGWYAIESVRNIALRPIGSTLIRLGDSEVATSPWPLS
jgi:hypothetical protein